MTSVDRMPELPRELRAVLERRRGGDEAAGRRREGADRALQNLLRAGAEHDVLVLGPELRRDGGDEGAVGGRAVERVAAGLGELAHDRVERRLARAERVLVAADADGLDAGRQRRPGLVPGRPVPPGFPRARVRQSRAPCHNPRLNALRPGHRTNLRRDRRMRSSPKQRCSGNGSNSTRWPWGRQTGAADVRHYPGRFIGRFQIQFAGKSACTSPAWLNQSKKKMMRKRFVPPLIALVLVALTIGAGRAYQDPPEYGPPKGTLVIVGGGGMEGTGIVEKFIQLAGGPDKKFIIVPTAGGNKNDDGSVRPYDETADHRFLGEARPQERQDAAYARSEGGRHGGLHQGPEGRGRGVVQRRPAVEHRRLVCRARGRLPSSTRCSSAAASSAAAPPVRRFRALPGARRHLGAERDDDRRADPSGGLQVPAPVGHRSAHQRAQPLGRPDPRHPEVSRTCSASASRRAPRSS